MNPSRFVRILVNVAQISGTFDYSVPDEFWDQVKIGSLVTVPFGKQTVQGIVLSFPQEPAVLDPKRIESVVDQEPVVNTFQMELAQWMAQQNLTSPSACIDLMLPPGLSQHADTLFRLVNRETSSDLSPLQQKIINLLSKRGDLRGRQLDTALPHQDWRKSISVLVKNGLIHSQPILQPPTIRPKVVRTAQYRSNFVDGSLSRKIGVPESASYERRQRVLAFLQEEAIPVNVTWVYAETGANSADLNLLAELELIQLNETEIWRDPLANLQTVFTTAPELTPEQSDAVKHLKNQLHGEIPLHPNLLLGVTGSGKTEVYLQAVEETLALGKQAIILVPEISLTPQTVRRFFARFPGKVGLIHSKLSPGERYDTWRRIRAGSLPVVVGARSALFAPLANPGLIVIDECHDGSYHQEDSEPRYHTVETSIQYAEMTHSVLLLGSATPETEQYYRFQSRNWNILKMPNRIFAHRDNPATLADQNEPVQENPTYLPLPKVEVVDMRAELVAGNRSALSRSLHESIQQVLARQEQAILLLNRRGSASYVFCRDCGNVLRCSRCGTQMTYHEQGAVLRCHHCNYQRQMPAKCPVCHNPRIKQFGLGTESLEKLIVEQFPEARVLRWDADTSRTKGAHDLILDHFSHHRADILIGTQMLAKGLDLPLVTLVGVVLTDISINLPDFRAAERTFQLLTQVSGRAGRSALGGKVIFQSFQPEHYAIQKAAEHDLEGFTRLELEYRKKTGYPPFSRLVKLELRCANPVMLENAAAECGEQLAGWIKQMELNSTSLIGPAPCFYQRRAGIYRWQILLRGPNPVNLLQAHPLSTWQPAGVNVEITVDPVNLL